MPVLFYTAMFCGAPPAHKHALLAHGALRVFQCLAPNSPCNSAALWGFFFGGGVLTIFTTLAGGRWWRQHPHPLP